MQPGTTDAQFCLDIAAMFTFELGKKIQSKVLTDILNKKRVFTGISSMLFYGAYMYFEKVRMAEGSRRAPSA